MGWMADFGEYLPFDAVLARGTGAHEHNEYPADWAAVNMDSVSSAPVCPMCVFDSLVCGTGGAHIIPKDVVYFLRSGFTGSPGHARLFWLGDQLVTWDAFDGLRSVNFTRKGANNTKNIFYYFERVKES